MMLQYLECMQLPFDMCLQLGSHRHHQDEHPHPSKSAVALPPLSSPAATAQLSDILLIPSGLSYSESLFCHLQLLLHISKVCSSSHSVGENVN